MRLIFCNERKNFNCDKEEIISATIIKRSAIFPNSSINLSIGLMPKSPCTNAMPQIILGKSNSNNIIGFDRLTIFVDKIIKLNSILLNPYLYISAIPLLHIH